MTTKYIDPCDSWPDPEPMPSSLRRVPELDYQLLPASIRKWVANISDRQSSPAEFPVATAIVMMAAIIGTKVSIQPKRNDTEWILQPNLWGAVVGNPSCTKTPAVKEAYAPFKMVEEQFKLDKKEELEPQQLDYRKRRTANDATGKALNRLLEARIKADMGGPITKNIPDRRRLDDMNEDYQIEKEELDAMRTRIFTETCMQVSDATVEKLQILQSVSENGILMFRDEIAGWLEVISKHDRIHERRYYLEGWSGNGSSEQHRVSRETNTVENNCISVFGSMQPGKLSNLVKDAQGHNSNADGLLQRFQVLVWAEDPGLSQVDAAPDREASRQATDAFMYLYTLKPEDVGCIEHPQFPHLRFTHEATRAFLNWVDSINARARQLDPALQSHLVKYRSLAPSIALLFHLVDRGHGDVPLPVLERSIKVCEWLWQHARRVYSAGRYSERSNQVRLCQHILGDHLGSEFTYREVRRKGWSGITDKALPKLLNELVAMEWIDHIKIETGGRSSDLFRINPKLKSSNLNPEKSTAKTAKSPEIDTFGSNGSEIPRSSNEENVSDDPVSEKPEHTNNTSCNGEREYF